MKKILFAATGLIMAGMVMAAPSLPDREVRKQQRRERREERKEMAVYEVSEATREQFNTDFPAAVNTTWKQVNFEEALFLDGGVLKTAYYDYDNELVGTTTELPISELPEKAWKKIDKAYPGYEVEKVILYDDNESNDTDMRLFSRPVAGEDNYFALLKGKTKEIILQVSPLGDVSYFSRL
jgi:hypothetical protein